MTEIDRGRPEGAIEVGVRFRHNPKVYSFMAEAMRMSIGDKVLVRSEKGVDMGEVIELKGRVPQERADQLMPVVRKATPEDLAHIEEQEQRERQALKICGEKIVEHDLPMKLIDASLSFDNTRLVFYFSAEGRVDFRELVRDLAKTFRLRIELRQIGVRDEAKLLGGLGPCGRRLCCTTFMREFEPVGIRVAKDQGLALNPNKISGLCDRLMCCLLFEHSTYCALRDEMPSRGDRVYTESGPGTVREVMLLKEQVTVHLDDGTELTVKVCKVRPFSEGPMPQAEPKEGEAGSEAEAPAAAVASPAPAKPAAEKPRESRKSENESGRGRDSRGRGRSRSKKSSGGGDSRGEKQPSRDTGGQAEGRKNPADQSRDKSSSTSGSTSGGKKRSSRRRGGRRKSRGQGGSQGKSGGGGGGGKNDGGKT